MPTLALTCLMALAPRGSCGALSVSGEKSESFRTLYLIGDSDRAHDYESVYRASGGLFVYVFDKPGVFQLNAKWLKRLKERSSSADIRLSLSTCSTTIWKASSIWKAS